MTHFSFFDDCLTTAGEPDDGGEEAASKIQFQVEARYIAPLWLIFALKLFWSMCVSEKS